MKYALIVLFLAIFILSFASVSAQPLPRFEQYPVRVHNGKTVPPIPPTSQDRDVRCCIWVEDAGPINFAGKYRLTPDTCGSECITVHVVDRTTGMHFIAGSYGYSYIFGLDRPVDLPHGLEYRANSRLLIIHGCLGEQNCGSYYMLMNTEGLKRLRYTPFNIRPR